MSEYRIEKLRRAACVVLTDGRRLDGEIFVASQARLHAGPEDPLDHFNDDSAFFALARGDGDVLLVARRQIARVELPATPAESSFEDPHVGFTVEVTLSDGSCTTGCVFPEMPADRARLLDYLNAYAPSFLSIFGRDRTILVNRSLIAHVKQLS